MTDPQARLQTLLLLDLVDSTGLIERLGDLKAAEHLRRHDRFVRDLLKVHGGREIDKTDGFLLVFERPVQAAAFALTYQRGLKDNPELPMRSRIGVHVGEVVMYENSAEDVAAGAKSVELEGLAKPIAARLMSLALPGQILLSDVGHAMVARAHGELEQRFPGMTLRDHGNWHLKGVHEAMHVYELGEPGIAPFQRPVDVEKVRHDRRRLVLGSLAAGTVVAASGGGWWWWHNRPIHIPFEKRDWVVVGELVNTTRDVFFDETLSQAFRIALEQSQFVNLVPEIQVQDALARMRRDPAQTRLERGIACEVAQREAARAVIIPGVSYRGTRLTLTAETIQPETGRTAQVESVESASREALLGSMDELVRKVRRRIGESPADTQATPRLEAVTTGNLEALRAYSLAVKATADGKHAEALNLYGKATELDPEFATAYARLATIHFVREDGRAMEHALDQALLHNERLGARERDYLQAWQATLTDPAEAVDRWSVVASLYPDFAAAQHNYGTFAWRLAGRLEDAVAAFDVVTRSRHPLRAASWHHRGYCLLGLGRTAEALASFEQGKVLARNPESSGIADALTALGRFEEARAVLESDAVASSPLFDVEKGMRRACSHAAAGEVDQALLALDRAWALLPEQTVNAARGRLLLVRFSMDRDPKRRARWQAESLQVEGELVHRSRFDRSTAQERLALHALWCAWFADEAGFEAARDLYETSRALDESSVARMLWRIVLAMQANDPLITALPTGPWAYLHRLCIARRAARAGHQDEWQQALNWLRTHRGHAFGDWNSQFTAQSFCVHESVRLADRNLQPAHWLAAA